MKDFVFQYPSLYLFKYILSIISVRKNLSCHSEATMLVLFSTIKLPQRYINSYGFSWFAELTEVPGSDFRDKAPDVQM